MRPRSEGDPNDPTWRPSGLPPSGAAGGQPGSLPGMTPQYPYTPNTPYPSNTPNAPTPRNPTQPYAMGGARANAPTPPFPTPGVTPSAAAPARAFWRRATTRDFRRQRGQPSTRQTQRSTSSAPDGVPSPIPTVFSAVTGGQRGTVARQRFSGSGLTPRTTAQRQEDRARRVTLGLAGVAALLILLVALLIYNPAALFLSYGFAPGLRLINVDSHIPLIIFGTPQPPSSTPTPPPGSSPSATAQPGTATPTATNTPTPTVTNTPTPTDTPTPSYGATATVSFTTATQSVAGPAQVQGCPSGCSIGDTPIPGASKQYWESSQAKYAYTRTVSWTGNITYAITKCTFLDPINCGYGGGGSTNYGCGPYQINIRYPNASEDVGPCTLSFNPSGQSQTVYSDSQLTVIYTYDTWHPNNVDYYIVADPANCHAELDDETRQGNAWAASYISGVSGGGTVVSGAQVSQGNYICNPNIGVVKAGPFTVYESEVTYVSGGLAYHPGDAQTYALAALQAAVPGGYTLTSHTTCSPGVASINGNTILVNCQDTGTATYDWSASSDPKGTLAGNLAGKSLSQALNICNSTAGVVAGSCKISISGGNTSVMPSAASQIQITPQ